MKIFLFLYFLFIYSSVFSQTKIYLKTPKNHNTNNAYDYQYTNISDTIFVKVSHSEDMGHPYGRRYELRNDLASGIYEIYVNEIIQSSVNINTVKKEIQKTIFSSKGVIKEILYFHNDYYYKKDIYDEMGKYLNSIEPIN